MIVLFRWNGDKLEVNLGPEGVAFAKVRFRVESQTPPHQFTVEENGSCACDAFVDVLVTLPRRNSAVLVRLCMPDWIVIMVWPKEL